MTATAIERPVVPTEIPGPAGDPLLGMARPLRRDLVGTLLDGFAAHGDVVAYRIGPRWLRRQVVAVHHPHDVRRVLTEMDVFTHDTPSNDVLRELFGSNLVTAEGSLWRRQKRTLQPLMTRRAVARYTALIEGEARKAIEQADADADGAVDVAHEMERYALRVLGHTLFKEADGIDDDTIAALERLVPVVGTRVRSRATQAVRLPLALPTPRNRRFRETRDALHATVERVLARRAARERAGGAAVDDLLTRLRDARDPEDDLPLSAEEIRDQALIFLVAGHTTTSNALTSTLHLLGSHPEIQERVAQAAIEQDSDLERPDLVRASVQEALRLFPPAYALARRVARDTEIGGHPLRRGTIVLVSPWVTHRHPGFWEEPERFDPWRFMDDDRRAREAWFAFGGGARVCIGRHLALLEASVLVRALLRERRLKSLDELSFDMAISMRPAGPVRVRWSPR